MWDCYVGLGLRRAALETAALTLREPAPNTEALIMGKGIFEALLTNFARKADALCFAS
jgi:hypothetical protein